jgi:hypothetical protein
MKVLKNGEKVEMNYKDVCKELGYKPDVNFVKVNNQGYIGFTVGKPDEIRRLYRNVTNKGFTPSKSFTKRI